MFRRKVDPPGGSARTTKRIRLRWLAATVAVALVMVLVPMLWPDARVSDPAGVTLGNDAKLVTTKKIYSAFETPKLRLSAPERPIGWIFPGLGRAFAGETVKTKVQYDNKQVVDVPVNVTPVSVNSFDLSLAPKSAIKPGKYTVTAEWGKGKNQKSATESFAWGVLAVNTTQPEYTPGQTVNIQMGVLSSNGNTICDAPLGVIITTPSGEKVDAAVARSGQCRGDTYVEVPDYTATYSPQELGKYTVTARLSDSAYELNTTFQVTKTLAYKVVRTGPSRLFPSSPYQMKISITPQSDIQGKVTERLPTSFKITQPGTGITASSKDSINISWDVVWQAGRTYELAYTFRAPLVSPAFYEIKPLTIQEGNRQAYAEGRKWQIASDAIITYVKETNGNITTSAITHNITATSTSGNTLILMMRLNVDNVTTPQTITVTDSAANTWVSPDTAPDTNPPYAWQTAASNGFVMAYAVNAAAITQFSVTLTNSMNITYSLAEFTNIATASSVDQSDAIGRASATSQTTPTITTTNADDLVIGGLANPNGSTTTTLDAAASSPTSGYTELYPGIAFLGIAYQIMTATGSYSIAMTLSSARAVGTGIMAFKNYVSGCTPVIADLMRGGNYFCNGAEMGYFWAT